MSLALYWCAFGSLGFTFSSPNHAQTMKMFSQFFDAWPKVLKKSFKKIKMVKRFFEGQKFKKIKV